MPRRHRDLTFRKADVTRAYKAAVDAGIANPRIIIDTTAKTITIVAAKANDEMNELDCELEEFKARHGETGR